MLAYGYDGDLEDSLKAGGQDLATVAGGVIVGKAFGWIGGKIKLPSNTPNVDINKLHHIFDKLEHKLGGLVDEFGTQEKAFSAMQKAINAHVKKDGVSGVFEESVKVGSHTITVRGNVVDGVAKIGTAFVP